MKISVRLGLCFAMLVVLLLVNAYVGWSSILSGKEQTDLIVHSNNQKIRLAYELQDDLNEISRAVRNYVIYQDRELQETMRSRIAKNRQKLDQDLAKIKPLVSTAEGQQLHAAIEARKNEVMPLYGKILPLVDEGNTEAAAIFLSRDVQPVQDALFGLVRSLIDWQMKLNQDAAAKVEGGYARAIQLMLATVAGSLVLSVILAFGVTRSITRPLGEAVMLANAVAAGDLTHHIEARGTNETGQLLSALRDMTSSLTGVVGQVRNGTQTIAAATQQIAAGNLDLSSRTEAQASSLEETASSMEQLTFTVRQNADNAQQANKLATEAAATAHKGKAVVDQVVGRMNEISDSSTRIAEITGMIESIAFQTNILALNAAVEAARAGEQGRGFAVVATEVRTLAQRSSSAAKDIKTLIATSVEKIQSGALLVDDAGKTMSEVTHAIERVTGIMGDIASASSEQSRGIEQVSQSVTQMDEATQQNAALVEQAAAASAALQEQGHQLSAAVAFFRVDATA
ncbi:methyl-accepting chemotaxis protein [Ralstonia psammae]|nr:methyl-accepting chemotaxis protein [Ralstonia sp. LMG 19083]